MFLNAGKTLKLFGLFMLGVTTTTVVQSETLLDQSNFFSTLNNNPNINGSFRVTEDITLTSSWTPVGTPGSPASLNFNGSYYVISGLNVETTAANTPTGLFGYLVDSWVHSVILHQPAVISHGDGSETGAIAGRVLRTNITGNIVTGGSVETYGDTVSPDDRSRYSYAGGITGSASSSRIENNLNNATVHTTGIFCHAGGTGGYQEVSTTSGNMNTGDVSTEGDYARAGGTTGYQEHSSTTSCNLNTGDVSTMGNNAFAGGATGYQYSSTTSCNLNTGDVKTEGTGSPSGGMTGYQYSSTTSDNVNTGAINTGIIGTDVPNSYAGGATGYQYSSTTSGNINTGAIKTVGDNGSAGGTGGSQESSSTISANMNTGDIKTEGIGSSSGGMTGYQHSSTTSGNMNTGDVKTEGHGATAGGTIGKQYNSTARGNLNSGSFNAALSHEDFAGFTQVTEQQLKMGLNGLNETIWISGGDNQFPMLRGVNPAYRDLQRINGTRYGNNAFPMELNEFADPGGSTDDSLFDLAVWNVCCGYLPFPKAIGRARAEAVGIDCYEGGFACDCSPEVDCLEPAACLFTSQPSGTIEHLLYDGQHYHGIVKAASGLAYWTAYEDSNQVALEPCGVYGFPDLSPSGIVVDAAVSDGNNAYVVYHIPGLPEQAQPLMLAMFTLNGQQHVSSSILGLDRVVSLSIDDSHILVNTGQDVCRLPVENTRQEPECDSDLPGLGEVIQSVAGGSGYLYLLTHEAEAGYRIRAISDVGDRADFMVSIPSGTSQGSITPALKIIGEHLHLLLVDQDLIIWRQYPLADLSEVFNDAWESELTAPMPKNITPSAITLIPGTDAGLEQDQVFVLGHNAGQPKYVRLTAIDFTASVNSTASPDSTGRHSGTQVIYPSWLLAAAALVPLLKWQH